MNNTEKRTMSEQQNLTDDITWWVRFDEHSGKIYGISQSPVLESEKYSILETNNKICLDVLKNGAKDYVVRWNPVVQTFDVGDKTSRLYLHAYACKFKDVENTTVHDAAITFKISTQSKELYMVLNKQQVQQEFNLNEISSLVYDETQNYFDCYITSKSNPDKLLKTIKLDNEKFFNDGFHTVDISDIIRDTELRDISIFTKHVFSNYNIEYIDYLIAKANDDNTVIKNVLPADSTSHLDIMKKAHNKLLVTCNISQVEDNLLRATKNLKILVSDVNIDNIRGAFSVNVPHILQHRSEVIELDFEIPDDPVMIHKNDVLTISYKGETDD